MERKSSRSPSLITLILLCGLSVVSLSLFLPSLANIATTFEAQYALINLSIAGYAAMTAVVQLIAGPLSDRYGRRPVMLGAIAIFALASLGCLFAPDVWTFLGFRMLQSVIISGYAISMAVVRDTHSTERSAIVIGYITAVSAIAPMLGPVIGGALDEAYGWRSSLVLLAVFGFAMFVLCWFDLKETKKPVSDVAPTRWRSYQELVLSRRFWGYSLCMAFCNGSFYVFLGGAPLVAKSVFEVSTAEVGFYMATITVGFILGSVLSSRLMTFQALTATMLIGRVVACFGLILGLITWLSGIAGIELYFLACASVGVGNGLTVAPSVAGVLSVKPELAGSAAGLNGALAVALGAVMSGISGILFTESNVAYSLLLLMLLPSFLGMCATFYVIWVDNREGVIDA